MKRNELVRRRTNICRDEKNGRENDFFVILILRRDWIKNIIPYDLCCATGSQSENIIGHRKYLALSLRGRFSKEGERNKV